MSTSWLTDEDGMNWIYELPGATIYYPKREEGLPEWSTPMVVEQVDPLDATESLSFSGIVGSDGDVRVENSFTFGQLKILHDIKFTVFTYELKEPLERRKRWVRLKFKARTSAHNVEMMKHRTVKRMTNLLHYQYEICGPYDVKKRFITYLRSTARRCEKKGCSAVVMNDVKGLLAFLEEDGLVESNDRGCSSSIFERIFLHVNPGDLERLTDFIVDGALKVAGFTPNLVITRDGRQVSLYEWKVIKDSEKEFAFTWAFQAKPYNLIYPMLPWIAPIAFVVSIAALVFGLYRGCAQNNIRRATFSQSIPAEKTQPVLTTGLSR